MRSLRSCTQALLSLRRGGCPLPWWVGFSLRCFSCRTGSVAVLCKLGCSAACAIFPDKRGDLQDSTHCTTREVLLEYLDRVCLGQFPWETGSEMDIWMEKWRKKGRIPLRCSDRRGDLSSLQVWGRRGRSEAIDNEWILTCAAWPSSSPVSNLLTGPLQRGLRLNPAEP